MTIWIMPIFPVYMRYSQWWTTLFHEKLTELAQIYATSRGKDVHVKCLGMQFATQFVSFGGEYNGSFNRFGLSLLDFEMAYLNDLRQLILNDQIQSYDVILFLDSTTPGLVASFMQSYKPCRIVGFCHGTAFNTDDIWKHNPARTYFDMATLKLFDTTIVASTYHASKLIYAGATPGTLVISKYLPENPVLTNLLASDYVLNFERSGICVVDRPGTQKISQDTIDFLTYKGFYIENIHGRSNGWEEFYRKLSSFRYLLVTAREETYGYQIQEAMKLGVIPLCPNNLCYPEFVPKACLYNTVGHLCQILDEDDNLSHIRNKRGSIVPLNENEAIPFWTALFNKLVMAND